MDKYLLGIDIGTTDVKAIIFSLSGQEISCFRYPNRIELPVEGCFEQDMNELWDCVVYILQKLFENSNISPENIIGIGLSGQGEGLWLIDHEGNPIRPAILWNDTRAMDLVSSTDEFFHKKHKKITGSEPGPGGTNFLLKWLSINEPENLKKADCCFYCKDWIAYKLTGNKSVELTDMSTSLLDLESSQISAEMFDILNIPECKKLFPKIINSHDIVGSITADVAKLTGLAVGTPVSAGYIDVVATGIGIGAINDNEVCSILGTSCISEFVSSNFNTFKGNAAYLKHGNANKYYCLIGTMSGTPNIDWILNGLFSDFLQEYGKTPQLFKMIEGPLSKTTVGSQGIVYHPYIRGERAPFLNINARASFFGVTEKSDRWDMLRSVYEGLAYSIKDCFQSYTPSHLFLTGGGSNSKILVQIIADCLGIPVTVSHTKEVGAKGAAISAGIAIGLFTDLTDAVEKFKVSSTTVEPCLENTLIYQEYFVLYKDLQNIYSIAWDQRNSIITKLQLQKGE